MRHTPQQGLSLLQGINKFNRSLSEFLSDAIMDKLFKRRLYAEIDSYLHHNAVNSTLFLPGYSVKMIIDHLVHNPLIFKYVSPNILHQKCYFMCHINGKCSTITYFVKLVLYQPQTLAVGFPTITHISFSQNNMAKHSGNCLHYHC